MKTNWLSSLLLFISVAICAAIILGAQYFVFMPMLRDAKGTNQLSAPSTTVSLIQDFLPTDKQLQACKNIADGRSLAPDTTCLVTPTEVVQTYSAIKIWSYKDHNWINPPSYLGAGQRTLISPKELQKDLPGPVILTCPWGCTLGYP